MKKFSFYFKIILLINLLFIFSGCSFYSLKGERFLQQKDYKDGYLYFDKKVHDNKDNDLVNYYYARFLLAKNKPKLALKHFNKAILLNTTNSDYYTWQGVAYNSLKNYDKELEAYKKAIALDNKNIHALTYLGHNYFEQKKYILALDIYSKALKLNPENKTALYNRALSLKKLKRFPEELQSWKLYLDYYPSGYFAVKAVEHLNNLGSFEYKNHIIGIRKVTLKDITFKPLSHELSSDSEPSLDVVGNLLTKLKSISIHIIVYQLNNKKLAEQKATKIREYLLKNYKEIDSNRLKLSWLNQSKSTVISEKKAKLDETVDFITFVK